MRFEPREKGPPAPLDVFSRIAHVSFEMGILLKGVDGVLEVAGGILLSFLTPQKIGHVASLLTQHELSRDPNDFIAGHLALAAQGFSASARTFAVLFLLSHGLVKVGLVGALWRSQLWAYPTAMAVFAAFGAYQIYRFTLSGSTAVAILTLLDAIVIWLTWEEYGRLRKGNRPSNV